MPYSVNGKEIVKNRWIKRRAFDSSRVKSLEFEEDAEETMKTSSLVFVMLLALMLTLAVVNCRPVAARGVVRHHRTLLDMYSRFRSSRLAMGRGRRMPEIPQSCIFLLRFSGKSFKPCRFLVTHGR
ncbi:Hypp8061 [Branchiostoma lanceolatum]|uniref:Hypp8061 protein n=1 Tax=Branchiostoma lanceolatum TaxID=7740 RepID=A0A8J9Z559_BRALA|nr:Hypp8061 [Branchiostoma lanceolatum]